MPVSAWRNQRSCSEFLSGSKGKTQEYFLLGSSDRCLYKSSCFEEAKDHCIQALEHTGNKPIFLYYLSASLFALNKQKEALLQLEKALSKAPRHLKKFIELNPSILQSFPVVDLIARYKRKNS
jgi:tetratricopeptide (TPR) repeat protein